MVLCLFADLRLYKESNNKKSGYSGWECVCLTTDDRHSFLKQFRKSSNQREIQLHDYLSRYVFPCVHVQLEVMLIILHLFKKLNHGT